MLLINDLKLRNQQHFGLIQSTIKRVVSSGWYTMGPELDKFEQSFANYIGTSHALGVANGTDALEISLRALGCGAEDEIITVANAGGYASTAILKVGSKPIYVDVEKEMQDGKATPYDIVAGKGSSGEDLLAENQGELYQKIQAKTPSIVFTSAFSSSSPTDPAGAVGPNHYVAVFNTGFRVFDKDGGGTIDTQEFFLVREAKLKFWDDPNLRKTCLQGL